MRLKEINPEVFVADEPIVKVSREEINFLKERVRGTPRGRIRLCAHPASTDLLHEMMIVLARHTYIRPHRHFHKSESFHVIEGSADIVLFEEEQTVAEVIELGDLNSGRKFFYRLGLPRYHTVIIHSEWLIIHETTNGPFQAGDAKFAPWAPEENDPLACKRAMASWAAAAQNYLAGRKDK